MALFDHVSLAARNLYEAAFRLRAETGLGFYDGGWSPGGLGAKVFPLGAGAYLIVEGLVDPLAAANPANPTAVQFLDGVRAGDVFRGFALRAETPEALSAIAIRLNEPPPKPPGATGRLQTDGERLLSSAAPTPPRAWPRGLPIWNHFPDMPRHPSGQPVSVAPKLVRPRGVAWIEVGGDRKTMERWLDGPIAGVETRFNDRSPGLYALGVRTSGGEVVIRRPPMTYPAPG